MTRVLIADDCLASRVCLREVLSRDPGLFIVAEGRDGGEAARLNADLRPDIIVLAAAIARPGARETIRTIMGAAATPIVVISSATEPNDPQGETAIHALRAGAVAILPRPAKPGDPAFEPDARRFNAMLRSLASVRVTPTRRQAAPPPPAAIRPAPAEGYRIICVATSTGGPAALRSLLAPLPANFPVPITVVQHMAPGFTPQYVSWLNTVCRLRVKVASDGERLEPHTVYLAPEQRHLGFAAEGIARLSEESPIGGFRPSGNFLFASQARHYGARGISVILSGMGRDGVLGLRAVRDAGGRIIAQDRQTSAFFEMPKTAIGERLAEVVLPVGEIPAQLLAWLPPARVDPASPPGE